MQLTEQKLCWQLDGRREANFSKPERIGYTQEFGLLGSLFQCIDMAKKDTGRGGGIMIRVCAGLN